MTRAFALFLILGSLTLLAACGDDSTTDLDLSVCGPATCSATQAFSRTTCKCEPADLAVHD